MTAAIVGWAHSRFGKLEDETLESMIVKVATDALDHAGIGPDDVDEIVLGHFNAGFSPQDFTASLVLQADDRFRFKPATRVENACATGSAAVRQGFFLPAITSGSSGRPCVAFGQTIGRPSRRAIMKKRLRIVGAP